MKRLNVFFAAVAMLATSCASESIECESGIERVPVTVRTDGFSVEQGDFGTTRAQSVGDYANAKALTLAFYGSDGTQVYKHTQYKDDSSTYTTYGEFSTSLPLGSYTMVVLASSGTNEATNLSLSGMTSASYSDYVRETFAAHQTVTVDSYTPLNLTATLDRIVAKVNVESTDGRSADVHTIRTTFSGGGLSFNPITGLNVTNAGFSKSATTSKPVGSTTSIVTALFLASDEQTMDVTIETLDESNKVLFSKTVKNVTLRRNRQTTLTGAMYSTGATAGTFTLNTDYLDGNTVNF